MIINESVKFRKFNKSDWVSYSGATTSEDGKLPLIADGDDFTIIVSASDYDNTVSIMVTTDEFDNKYKEFSSYDKAMYVANNILKMANTDVSKLNSWIKSWRGY